jgi:amino acid adenylation domain-containing protein
MDLKFDNGSTLLHAPFEALAAASPDRIALRCGRDSLSYGELNARADALAARLRQAGVGPDVLVGLFVERTLEAIVGLIAILKAGGAYVPLDPANPPLRNRFILEDAKPRLVVAYTALRERIGESLAEAQARVLWLDEPATVSEAADAPALPIEARPEHLAYVIYTSGSTGKPKGTLITHRNVDRLFRSTDVWFNFGAEDVWTVFHSMAFDFSVWELWGALRYGGTAVLVPAELARNPAGFRTLLRDEGISVLCQTPSAFNALMEAERALPDRALPALRWVIFGGEALEFKRLRPWFEAHGESARLINMYGITETTVHVSFFDVKPAQLGEESAIGVPLPDLQVHLLDEQLRPVPAGEIGEIFVAGPGVARGYLNRPELTAQRFIANPLPGGEGTLYRSGDLARLRADGQLVFCGRADGQVKIRGYRIELGEIAAALQQCPNIRSAEVLLREGAEAGRMLVAYLQTKDGRPVSPAALRQQLAATLPVYMLPAAFVAVPEWPLTVNGKLDRAALPAPRREDRVSRAAAAPRNEAEARVAALWTELLGEGEVGVHDNFFELGAHSLMVARACAGLSRSFGVPLAVTDVLAAPTVAALAEKLGAAPAGSADPGPSRTEAGLEPAPTALAQDAALFFAELTPDTLAYNNQVLMSLRGPLRIDVLERAIEEIVRRHEILRTTFVRMGGQWRQRVHPPYAVKLAVVDDAPGVLHGLYKHHFDPGQLPLLVWTLVRRGPNDHVLAHVEHHLIHDGWSFSVFARELMALYDAFHASRPSPLPELALQFGDFARWQRRRQSEGALDAGIAYWKQSLQGAPLVLDLPTDKPRPAAQTFRGDEIRFDVPAPLARGLRAYARSRQTSLFTVMLAGFAATLGRIAGQREVLIGSGYANRQHPQMNEVMGMIVNLLPLRIAVDEADSFDAAVASAKQAALQGMAYQDVPFEAIARALGLRPDRSRNPICQVAFSFHDSNLPPLRMADLSGEIEYPHNGSAKFDMNVIVVPHAEQQGLAAGAGDEHITVKWDCNTDLFEMSTLQRIIDVWLRDLAAAIAAPSLALGSVLTAAPAGARRVRARVEPRPEPLALARESAAAGHDRAPESPMEVLIAEIWQRLLGCSDIGVDEDFFAIGGHSLAAAAVFAELGQRLGSPPPLSLLFEARTIAALAKAIEQRHPGDGSHLFVPVRARGQVGQPPIYAMLGVGGNYIGAEALAVRLGGHPFYSLEMPGLVGESAPQAEVEAVVDRLHAEILRHSSDRRCVLMGACAGALVVHELARRLESDGFAVEHLLMVDPPASGAQRSRRMSSFSVWRYLALPRFVVARAWLALRLLTTAERGRRREFLRQKVDVLGEIVRRRDLLREARVELHVNRVREATSDALSRFVPAAYSGRTALLMGERYSSSESQAVADYWRNHCVGRFEVAHVPGRDTGSMLRSPHVDKVAERVLDLLAHA